MESPEEVAAHGEPYSLVLFNLRVTCKATGDAVCCLAGRRKEKNGM